MKDWEYHPLAEELTPPMPPEQFAKLKESIRLRGVRKPAMQFEGKLLDGRHRHRALKELRDEGLTHAENGVELDLVVRDEPDGWTRKDAALFVADENLHRRQMTKDQLTAKAVALVKILEGPAKERQREAGGDKKSEAAKANVALAEDAENRLASREAKRSGKAAEQAAEVTGLSRATVERAVKVDKQGTDELKDALAKGEIKPKPAAALASKPKAEQKAAVAKIRGEEPPAPEPDAPIFPADVQEWFGPLVELMERHQRAASAYRNWLLEFPKKGDERTPFERLLSRDADAVARNLLNAIDYVKAYKPHAVCPACEGTGRMRDDECSTCKGAQVVTKSQWDASSSEGKSRVYVVR